MPATFEGLLHEPCPTCGPSTPRLTPDETATLLGALGHGWQVAEGRLRKRFSWPDFASGLAYVVRVGAMSDAVGHHPDVALAWGRVDLEIWTHAVGGLTAVDFAWAARAEKLALA